jgi:DtxR family Mn-dependent transcriptional regulator
MATESVENYLKALYMLCRDSPSGEAGVVRLATEVGVTKGSAASMVKKLAIAKLVKAQRYGGVSLTARGTKTALDVLRRHRLIETFLVQTLKLDWSEVHEEAERLEHAVSARLLDRLDEFLGRPATDPHGDPIPDASGMISEPRGKPLSAFPAQSKIRILRIADQDRAFLTFVAAHGIKPGARAIVDSMNSQADSLQLHPHGHDPVSLSCAAAAKILAEPAK